MSWTDAIRARLRLLLGRTTAEERMNEEFGFHLEMQTRENLRRGMSQEEARRQAVLAFGGVEGHKEVMRETRGGWLLEEFARDARYAVRALRRSPGFALVAVLTLALGIGATTAIFTVVNGVLLRPLGVADPEGVVVLRESPVDAEDGAARRPGTVSPANFFDWRAQARSFASMAYFTQWPLSLTGGGEPQEAQVQLVSAEFFGTLGVQPLLGRTFRPDEDDDLQGQSLSFGNVAVLSHRLWQSRYGGDPGIVGRTVRVADMPLTVVGVMGPDFRVLDQQPDLWMPLALVQGNRTSMGRFLTGVARLRPGVTPEQADREMKGIARRLAQAHPAFNAKHSVTVSSLREDVVGEVRPALLVLLAAVGMLLLIACTNVANLLLGRASARRQEIVVRLSLGASRGRLVRQLLTESLVLSLVGGVLGLAVAALGTRALLRSLPESVQLPRLDAVAVDGPVLGFALAVTLLTGLLFGLAPALVSSRADLQSTLRDAGRGSIGGRASARLRSTLVVAEVALALMLLVGAGLLLRSFQKLQAVDTGMHPQGVLTLRMSIGSDAYQADEARRALVDRLIPALRGLPGVQAVGAVSHLPLTNTKTGHTAFRPDRPAPGPGESPPVDLRIIAGDYFPAQGIRLVRGRSFDARDHGAAPQTMVINEALARQQFPGEDPIGKRLGYPWPELIEGEIIGIVEDIRETSLTEAPAPALYRAFAQHPDDVLNVMIRTTGDPMALAGAAREVVRRIDPNLPVARVRTMESVVADATARSRMSGYLVGSFAALALLLAAIGLYGIISYGVTQRRGEIGVRVALGADRGSIVALIVRQGMRLTAAGLAVGLLGALTLTGLLRSMLFGVTTTDLATFVVVPLLLILVALLASYLPASSAARVDPATALRAQ